MRRTELTMIVQRLFLTMAMLALCSRAVAAEAGPVKLLDFTKGDKPDTSAESYYLTTFGGIPNDVEAMDKDATQMYVATIAEGKGDGVLQVGDVILGINGNLFTGEVIRAWRAAAAEARLRDKRGTLRVIRWRNGIQETVDYFTVMVAPDLTVGTNRFKVDRTSTYNLGPTGMRGWIYRSYYWPGGQDAGAYGLATWEEPWQILVTTVGTGTPAYGILAVDDVILGAKASTGAVPLFTNDARKSLGWAIGDAEAADGALSILINRYGVPSNQTHTIQLGLTGFAYSATAPYTCPKSARILADAVKVISNMSFTLDEPGNAALGLAKMAAGITDATVRAYALSLCPTNGTYSLTPYSGCDTWGWGYKNVFLSEYLMLAGDNSVTTGIRELTIGLAKGQSLYGTFGHGGAEPHADGSLHGSIQWYGPVNSAGLVANMGIVLGKKAGVVHQEIDPAIDRASKFFGYYVDKGSIPYGEHETWGGHGSNGKDAMAAMFFALQGTQPTQTEYWTRMCVAGFNGREYGHTGQGFSYLWLALAANIGGTNALASHLAQVRWHLDLSRRCDGSFVYDGDEQYGGSPTINDYWQDSSYYGLDPSACYVLTFSVPSRRLYLTGKNPNPTNMLSSAAVSNALWAGMYHLNLNFTGYTTNELLSHFYEYDPIVRTLAADSLGKKPGSNTLVNLLMGMTTSNELHLREAACQALGVIGITNAMPTLVERLYDTDMWVRTKAAYALQQFGTRAFPHLTNIMTAFVANATDPDVIVWSDPVQIANGKLANLLFTTLGASTIGAPTNLMYAAIRAGLKQPDGAASGQLCDFIQNRLSLEHVKSLAPSIIAATAKLGPADRMFSFDIRYAALQLLAKFSIEEGIPVSLLEKEQQFDSEDWIPFDVLKNVYRGAAKDVLPTLHAWQANSNAFYADQAIGPIGDRYSNLMAKIAETISAITNDPAPPTLNYFKKITAACAVPNAVTLPASNVALYSSEVDADQGTPVFVWSKTHGVGNVTFTPNSSSSASNCTATFSVPGTYVLQLACVDKSILDSNVWIRDCNGHYYEFQTYTNIIGAVYTNITVTVHGSAGD